MQGANSVQERKDMAKTLSSGASAPKYQIITRTAEFVSPGHPDKMCDILSDYILDLYLAKDPKSRVAVEVMGGHGELIICGEVTSAAKIDIEKMLHAKVGDKYNIHINLVQQSPEIARGVDDGGAGDQGIMVGYACAENELLLPMEYVLARDLCQKIYSSHPFDGKTQITASLKYDTKHRFVSATIKHIVVSWQKVSSKILATEITAWINNLPNQVKLSQKLKVSINPAGDWNLGGFDADTGLTGRKIVIDNYGPRVPVGGGAFSGKDPSKVDRSAAYMARKIAVDYLKKYEANEVLVNIAYALGEAKPVDATAIIDGKMHKIADYDLSPLAIIEQLNLAEPHYERRAKWGHFTSGLC